MMYMYSTMADTYACLGCIYLPRTVPMCVDVAV